MQEQALLATRRGCSSGRCRSTAAASLACCSPEAVGADLHHMAAPLSGERKSTQLRMPGACATPVAQ